MIIVCSHCKKEHEKSVGHVNRANKLGRKLYCSKVCFGLGRRNNLTIDEKKKIKSDYDKKFRKIYSTEIKKAKAESFQKDYTTNPEKYKQIRIKRKEEHKKYIQTEKYKKWKAEYDIKYLAKKEYGEFADCYLLVKEIEKQYDDKEIRQINNLHNKSQKRKQKWKTQQSKTNYLPRI